MTDQKVPVSVLPDARSGDRWGLDDTTNGVIGRFDIQTDSVDVDAATASMSMSLSNLRNPLSGRRTAAPLTVLVDAVAGVVNHFRRETDRWTVTSELSLDLDLGLLAEPADRPDIPVTAHAQTIGSATRTSLSTCVLRQGDAVVGTATARSFFVPVDAPLTMIPSDPLVRERQITLGRLMSVVPETSPTVGTAVLYQRADPPLINAIGIVNGGVSSAGLEIVASAVVDDSERPLRTASLRVNFLRGFYVGSCSRYEATAVHNGRGSAVADARAINDDGSVAIMARLTGYR